MKSVTFGASAKTKEFPTAYDLREQVITFLTAHGMIYASEITSVKDDTYVYVNPDCANSNFTRALALFQLIFSVSGDSLSSVAYIAYRPNEGGMRLTVSSGCTYRDVIDYIKEHMEITIA